MKTILPASAVIVGLLLVALGFSWSSLFPASRVWTPEKNERKSELASEITRLRFAIVQAENNPNMQSGPNPAELKSTHLELKKEFDLLQEEFENARDSPGSTGSSVKWLGIILTVGGSLFVFANRQG